MILRNGDEIHVFLTDIRVLFELRDVLIVPEFLGMDIVDQFYPSFGDDVPSILVITHFFLIRLLFI